MNSPSTSSPRPELCRRAVRWLLPAALLALAPKCFLCVLAYVGLGTAIGVGGPEICGASGNPVSSWATLLAWLGGVGGLGVIVIVATLRAARAFSRCC